jgi:hypothetical protein
VSSVTSVGHKLPRRDPVERLPAARIEFVTNDGRRRIEPVIEAIDGQRLRRLAVLQDDDRTIAAGDVDASSDGDRGGVEIRDVAKALGAILRFACPRVENGHDAAQVFEHVQRTLIQERRRDVWCVAIALPEQPCALRDLSLCLRQVYGDQRTSRKPARQVCDALAEDG